MISSTWRQHEGAQPLSERAAHLGRQMRGRGPVQALRCLPLCNVADLHPQPQTLRDGAGSGAAVHADAVGVHQSIDFTGMQDLMPAMSLDAADVDGVGVQMLCQVKRQRNATGQCVGAYCATESGRCNYERFRRLDTELEVAECAYGREQSACCVDHHLTNASAAAAGQKINPARETNRFGRLVHLECKHHPQAVLLMHRNLQQSQPSSGFKNSTQHTRHAPQEYWRPFPLPSSRRPSHRLWPRLN